MFFASTAPSPYDVRFKLLGVPVRIAPAFWVIALFLGGANQLDTGLVWVAAVLVSVLVHELGHAVVQRAFGGRPEVTLYAFGGLASAVGVRDSWWRQVLISLAGPAAGFALYGLVRLVVARNGVPQAELAVVFAYDLLLINWAWSVFNLAPIWPLDGGRVARELLVQVLKPETGVVVSLVLSVVCAAALGVYLFQLTHSLWNAALCAMLAMQSYETLTQYRASRGW